MTTQAASLNVERAAHAAYRLLHTLFVAAPVLFGLDKFVGLLTNWDQYLAPRLSDHLPGTPHQAMYVVGVIEIVAGLVVAGILVAIAPRIGAYVVAAWLAGIIVDLLLLGGHGDIALRDFGLLVAALALAQLAPAFTKKRA